MRRALLRWSVFILLPVITLEAGWRFYLWLKPLDWFYPGVIRNARAEERLVLFIGSSRVAAAIQQKSEVASLYRLL